MAVVVGGGVAVAVAVAMEEVTEEGVEEEAMVEIQGRRQAGEVAGVAMATVMEAGLTAVARAREVLEMEVVAAVALEIVVVVGLVTVVMAVVVAAAGAVVWAGLLGVVQVATTGEVAQAKAELVKATEAARMEVATRGMVSAVEVEAEGSAQAKGTEVVGLVAVVAAAEKVAAGGQATATVAMRAPGMRGVEMGTRTVAATAAAAEVAPWEVGQLGAGKVVLEVAMVATLAAALAAWVTTVECSHSRTTVQRGICCGCGSGPSSTAGGRLGSLAKCSSSSRSRRTGPLQPARPAGSKRLQCCYPCVAWPPQPLCGSSGAPHSLVAR